MAEAVGEPPSRRVRSTSPEQTEALGAEVARALRAGDVVTVSGEVGAGKTTFIRGACRALGVRGPVTSPTFTIGQRYEGSEVWVSHLDLYRLGDIEDEEPALLDDYLTPDGIAFIEWPGAAAARLRRATVEVRLSHAEGDIRDLEMYSASHGE